MKNSIKYLWIIILVFMAITNVLHELSPIKFLINLGGFLLLILACLLKVKKRNKNGLKQL